MNNACYAPVMLLSRGIIVGIISVDPYPRNPELTGIKPVLLFIAANPLSRCSRLFAFQTRKPGESARDRERRVGRRRDAREELHPRVEAAKMKA